MSGILACVPGGGSDPLAVSISPDFIYKTNHNQVTGNLTTEAATATVTGGSGSFSYAWTRVSGVSFTINSPSAASTTFTGINVAPGDDLIGVYRVTVTDNVTGLTGSRDITVEIYRIDTGGLD